MWRDTIDKDNSDKGHPLRVESRTGDKKCRRQNLQNGEEKSNQIQK
jgi:hypothetical protein